MKRHYYADSMWRGGNPTVSPRSPYQGRFIDGLHHSSSTAITAAGQQACAVPLEGCHWPKRFADSRSDLVGSFVDTELTRGRLALLALVVPPLPRACRVLCRPELNLFSSSTSFRSLPQAQAVAIVPCCCFFDLSCSRLNSSSHVLHPGRVFENPTMENPKSPLVHRFIIKHPLKLTNFRITVA